MSQFHPTTWIDEQRAGRGGNVFDSILAASASIRRGQTAKADYRTERRIAGVHQIRLDALEHDRAVDPRGVNAAGTPTFGQLVQRWKSPR